MTMSSSIEPSTSNPKLFPGMLSTIQLTSYISFSVIVDADIEMNASQGVPFLKIGKLVVNQAELSRSAPTLFSILSRFVPRAEIDAVIFDKYREIR